MEDIYQELKKSIKKKKASEMFEEGNLASNQYMYPFKSFKKDISFNEYLKFSILDTIKGCRLHLSICLHKQKTWIGYLINYLEEFIFSSQEFNLFNLENESSIRIFNSLREYIKLKETFDKTSFIANSRYFKASKKIDKEKLIAEIEKDGGGGFSCKKYAEQHNHSFSTVRRYIKNRLGYVYIRRRLSDSRAFTYKNKNCVASFVIYLVKMIENEFELIFLDESSFDNHKRAKARWVNKRKMIKFHEPPSLKSVGNISCVSQKKLIHYVLRMKKNNSETIINFIVGLIDKLKRDKDYSHKYQNKKICLVMDNATIHKSKNVIDYLKTTNLNVCFLPPYTPNANPVEKLFLYLKQLFYQRRFRSV